jgi:hypothetical protein
VITAITPMMMPNIVKPERNLFAPTLRNAIRTLCQIFIENLS